MRSRKYIIITKRNQYVCLNEKERRWYLSENEEESYKFNFKINAQNLKKDFKLRGAIIRDFIV